MNPPKRHRKPPTRSPSTTQSTSKRRKFTTEQQNIVEVQIGAHGPEVVAPKSERATEIDHDQPTSSGILHHNVISGPPVVTSGPALSPNATLQNTGTFYQDVVMLGTGVSRGSMGLGIVQDSQTPVCTLSMLDPVGGHIPVKIKEKIWAGKYVDMNILLKSAKDLVSDSHLNGDLTVKGGQLTL